MPGYKDGNYHTKMGGCQNDGPFLGPYFGNHSNVKKCQLLGTDFQESNPKP